jgi:predicted RNA-binding protein
MEKSNYWLDLFTATTWKEFIENGANITGFRSSRWNTVQKIKTGDYFICYLAGVMRFVGILQVTGEAYKDNSVIWKDEDFPCRLPVKPIITLEPETAVPIKELKDRLSIFKNLSTPRAWTASLRSSPYKWKETDGDIILQSVQSAKLNPIFRLVEEKRLLYRPKFFKSKVGSVTIPEIDSEQIVEDTKRKEPTEHTEIQWLLLNLGSQMGFDIWVARNDRGKDFNGKKFSSLNKLREDLPQQFDDATNKTIELIDVLWLEKNAIVAAFEIESTTLIYSGLLRMSDLIAMQPNIKIPLYIVAPEDRQEKVITEINRPTFSNLKPKLSDICKYISFDKLKKTIASAEAYIQHMKPSFLDDLSESCDLN